MSPFVVLILVLSATASTAVKKPMGDIVPELFMSTFPTAVASNISEGCVTDSQLYASALLNGTSWALSMYESTGKFPESYVAHGKTRTQSTGLFDECLFVRSDSSFQGKYCTAIFTVEPIQPDEIDNQTFIGYDDVYNNWIAMYQLPQLLNHPSSILLKEPKKSQNTASEFFIFRRPSIGYCIPSSCSGEDFASAVAQQVGKTAVGNMTVNGVFYYTSIVTNTGDPYCFTKEQNDATPDFDRPDIVMIMVLSAIGLAVIIATLHESWRLFLNRPIDPKTVGKVGLCLHSFSALSNGRKLLSTNTPPSDLSCIHGIRFLSTTWVILLHTHSQSFQQPSYNKLKMAEDDRKWELQTINNAIHSVDTFFVLSGLLVAYSLLPELDRSKGRFNVLLFYIHRYLRLTPVYAIILGFTATLFVYIGTGPYWQIVHNVKDGCRYNWWTNLLYVNNYVPIWPNPKPCMAETWYLACDMQMFWMSPMLIYPLWRWRKAGLAWTIFVIAALFSATVAVYIVWQLPPTNMGTTRQKSPEKASFYYNYYFQTWARIPPYLVGILVGWLLHKTKRTQFVVAFGWILAFTIGLAIVYGLTPYLNEETVPVIDPAISVTYGSLHRLAWAAAVGWLIFACLHGYGGFINRLLSWKAFVPLGRLTYVAYLFHWGYVTKLHLYQSRKPYYYTIPEQIMRYLSVLTYVFMASFIICLLVEIPFLNLEKILVCPTKKSPNKQNEVPLEKIASSQVPIPNT